VIGRGVERAQGGFGFECLDLGAWELVLLRPDERGYDKRLGTLTLHLDGDRDGVVIVADRD